MFVMYIVIALKKCRVRKGEYIQIYYFCGGGGNIILLLYIITIHTHTKQTPTPTPTSNETTGRLPLEPARGPPPHPRLDPPLAPLAGAAAHLDVSRDSTEAVAGKWAGVGVGWEGGREGRGVHFYIYACPCFFFPYPTHPLTYSNLHISTGVGGVAPFGRLSAPHPPALGHGTTPSTHVEI